MRTGSKKIFHLEAWVVKIMSLQKVGIITLIRRVFLIANFSVALLFWHDGRLRVIDIDYHSLELQIHLSFKLMLHSKMRLHTIYGQGIRHRCGRLLSCHTSTLISETSRV